MTQQHASIPDDERAEERVRALLRARVSGGGLERDATILDISSGGLLVTAAVPPKPAHSVTIRSNGYAMTGVVKWVEDSRFGVCLQAPIMVDDVIEAKVLKPKMKVATTSLPENFGIRPESEPAALTLLNYLESKWVRYGVIVVVGLIVAVSVGNYFGEHAGKLTESMANMQEVSQAEGNATAQ
jgi:PilZ domain